MTKPDARRTLYTFHWLAFRGRLAFHDSLLTAASIRDLERYVNSGPAHDPEFNRIYRALDLIASIIGELQERKKRSPEQNHTLSLLDSYHRQLSARWAQIVNHGPVVMTDPELKRELQTAFTGGQRPSFDAVKVGLEARFKGADEPALKEEMHRYLGLMDSVDGTAPKQGTCLSNLEPVV